MNALTLWQPWATLIVIGAKKVETRSWMACFRGRFAAHAAKTLRGIELVKAMPEKERSYILDALEAAGYRRDMMDLPLGEILGTADLYDCLPMGELLSRTRIHPLNTERERAMGDWSYNNYGFLLKDEVKFAEPIPARGGQLWWRWDSPEEELARYNMARNLFR